MYCKIPDYINELGDRLEPYIKYEKKTLLAYVDDDAPEEIKKQFADYQRKTKEFFAEQRAAFMAEFK